VILTEPVAAPTIERAPALSPAQLLGVVRDLAHARDRWRELVRHTPTERWFLRVAAHAGFDCWLIGWDAHQGVAFHDHGGSAGALYVVDGELFETSAPRNRPRARVEQRLRAGTARAFGADHVHRVVNRSAGVATSVHVYSPPLVSMDFYDGTGDVPLRRTHTESALAVRSGPGELR
jgi:cysteine dioxygenase type I